MNGQYSFDAVVVGAGPAGSTAAYLLASSGFKVLILDKSAFPRNKLCGGLLTWKTVRLLENIFTKTIERIHSIQLQVGFGHGHGSFCSLRENSRIAGLSNDLLRSHFLDSLKVCKKYIPAFESHPLPFGNYLSVPGCGNIMLLGDACVLADPFLY
jgi:flavin-dependent dehydrogenase